MTPKQLAEIKARCEAASEGPWRFSMEREIYEADIFDSNDYLLARAEFYESKKQIDDNANFIAHARQDLPDCTAEIERLQKACRMAYEGLCTGDPEAEQKAIAFIDTLEATP